MILLHQTVQTHDRVQKANGNIFKMKFLTHSPAGFSSSYTVKIWCSGRSNRKSLTKIWEEEKRGAHQCGQQVESWQVNYFKHAYLFWEEQSNMYQYVLELSKLFLKHDNTSRGRELQTKESFRVWKIIRNYLKEWLLLQYLQKKLNVPLRQLKILEAHCLMPIN